MEDLLYQALVDVVFAGHVHTYDRFGNKANNCAPVQFISQLETGETMKALLPRRVALDTVH
ncbi:hypothetical protein glysoja_021511 [Glycine soja]|nr:hypothetical protein glysoja_021511 [Glycine soja]